MDRVMKRKELIEELATRTGFYKSNIKLMLEALDDVITENMSMATKKEPSELYLSLGFVIGGRYAPKREVKDPRNGETVMTPEKYIPYARFKQKKKKKINKKK